MSIDKWYYLPSNDEWLLIVQVGLILFELESYLYNEMKRMWQFAQIELRTSPFF